MSRVAAIAWSAGRKVGDSPSRGVLRLAGSGGVGTDPLRQWTPSMSAAWPPEKSVVPGGDKSVTVAPRSAAVLAHLVPSC